MGLFFASEPIVTAVAVSSTGVAATTIFAASAHA